MFDPIVASQNIKEEFAGYITTTFHMADKEYLRQFKEALEEEGAITKGPYLSINDSFKIGKSLAQLIDRGEVSALFKKLEGNKPDKEKEIQLNRALYLHQEQAVRTINNNKNMVVTTGTGSGKTECFIIPIINYLLKEKERKGELTPGVRAILIYPMNALANDQMKRLRVLLKEYRDITFGIYNSSTQQEEDKGKSEYMKIYKDNNGRPIEPLKNEVLSRKRMQEEPPHILVTNYAMLEYMLLRPKDDIVFSNAQLKFLVLDEAHIYRGATGMETALLLRRLKARIKSSQEVLHILTSATLGGKEADEEIVHFAKTLCNAQFYVEDIIRSEMDKPNYIEELKDIPLELFKEISESKENVKQLTKKYNIDYPENIEESELLYDLCVSSKVYRKIRESVTFPMTITEITSKVNEQLSVTESDIVNVIGTAVQADKNKMPLIKARYHMFAKALEGAYITLSNDKKMSLIRKKEYSIDGKSWRMFECAVCDVCGEIAIVGKNKVHNANSVYFTFDKGIVDENSEYYILLKDNEKEYLQDEENEYDVEEIDKNDYIVCAECGAIIHASLIEEMPCNHGRDSFVKIRKVNKKGPHDEAKCPFCNLGHFKRIYLGYDAATAVLGTSLFEQLPESEIVIKKDTIEDNKRTNLFRITKKEIGKEMIKKERQFITFSDSRGEAAFFACYMAASYKEFLRRRGIWHVVQKNKEDMYKHPWNINAFVNELAVYFSANRTFAEPNDKDIDSLTGESKRQAWIAVLNEMVNSRRSTSLVSLGIINFSYKGNSEEVMSQVAERYGKTTKDIKALFDLLVMEIVNFGALIEEDCELSESDKQYIYYTLYKKVIKKCKDPEKDKNKPFIASWMAFKKNGRYSRNNRIKRVAEVLDISKAEANDLLEQYWEGILKGEYSLKGYNEEYYFSPNDFVIQAVTEESQVFSCEKCGRTTMINCQDRCASIRCTGKLKKISHYGLLNDNHYSRLYSSPLMKPLHIKEHTAQLGRAEQQRYQELFIKKQINALSCSTTFEMGVDVGDLETVYLRNMPPTPANYVQRAGRAGRNPKVAAYALTYAKLSSHDFSYFKDPIKMIEGKIGVPLLAIKNEKVIKRHIFAIAISAFFSSYEEVYNENNSDVLLNGNGMDLLRNYLNNRPKKLDDLLKISIPIDQHEEMGIKSGSWVDELVGNNGLLTIAVEDYKDIVGKYKEELRRLTKIGNVQEAAKCERKLESYCKGKTNLIEFLVRNNILPKYGFPVDTVELFQNIDYRSENKLQMVRDLQLAVAEYAPGSEVVADGKLYTSRYIRKLPKQNGQEWDTAYIAQCGNPYCRTWNYQKIKLNEEPKRCIACNKEIKNWEVAIEPRRGFIAESKAKEVPMRKPERSYRSEDYYIGDGKCINKSVYYLKNGGTYQLKNSHNDSLMVVCSNKFYVCEKCGYTECETEIKNNTSHKTSWGKDCTGKLKENRLYHVFKSDVIQIVFETVEANKRETMLSVMYALLEATSKVLEIERNDIKGCLYPIKYNEILIYSIVLFDAVAGGAGHVSRLVTSDGKVFQDVIAKGMEITSNCKCSPSCYSCLRNYSNQRVHDLLDRKTASAFLKKFSDDVLKVDN